MNAYPHDHLECPDCRSEDVEPYYFESGLWHCHECGWEGYKKDLKGGAKNAETEQPTNRES